MDSVSRQYPQRNLHGRIVHTLGRRILRGEINPGDALDAGSVMAARDQPGVPRPTFDEMSAALAVADDRGIDAFVPRVT
jgi:DNA-binding FadR family transcriptional regulator